MEEELLTAIGALGYPAAWGGLGQGVSLPRVALWRIGGGRDLVLGGAASWARALVQVDCYGADYPQAVGVARAVETALVGQSLPSPILSIALESRRDGHETDGGVTIQRCSLDLGVLFST